MSGEPRARGSCLCGAVAFEVLGPLRDVINCHCGQCRRTHGAAGAYTNVNESDLHLTETRGLKWYRSSTEARRGFCDQCGASLFWDRIGHETISIAAGALDQPTGLKTAMHIYTDDQADFYELTDTLPRYPGSQTAR